MTDASRRAPLTRDTVVTVADEAMSAALTDETVILSMRDQQYYGLDGVGHLVWTAARVPQSIGALVAAIVARYEVEPERALADLLPLVEELVERGLLRVADGSAPPAAGR